MISARDIFLDLLTKNKEGKGKGIYSVCSANPEVLEACFMQAADDGSMILIESTSNQVDQFGGYTGMNPAAFVQFVHSLAKSAGFPREKILLGGDHLGPNAWQALSASEAMSNARTLIADYVRAGYQKIHLDTSMFCADDKGDRSKPLADSIVASRAADLCSIAEETWATYCHTADKPVYIIGTEVPVPGGAQEAGEEIIPTNPEDAVKTIEVTRKNFHDRGLDGAWERVVGVVVQPGVEYGDNKVFPYRREKAAGLSNILSPYDHLVFEAHSTDYQTESALKSLVEDHFCILKVGPWLTFALREALFALEAMETELLGKENPDRSLLKEVLEKSMMSEPKYWKKYYPGNAGEQAFKRKYSFSDRSRYYWPMEAPAAAKNKLFGNLEKREIPLSLLSQFMPVQFQAVSEGRLIAAPADLASHYIRKVAGIYARACGLSGR